MENKDGELVETEKEVKEVYTEVYKDLLSTSVATTQKEQFAEDNVNNLHTYPLHPNVGHKATIEVSVTVSFHGIESLLL